MPATTPSVGCDSSRLRVKIRGSAHKTTTRQQASYYSSLDCTNARMLQSKNSPAKFPKHNASSFGVSEFHNPIWSLRGTAELSAELSGGCLIQIWHGVDACALVMLHDRISHHHHHHHHLSPNREGRRGTAGYFTTSFLHFSLFPIALWDLANTRPVHSLMLSSNLFLSALSSSPFHCALQDGFGQT